MFKAKKSYVWLHFVDKGKIATCKICSKDIMRSHSGTSAMSSHLLSQHQIGDPNKQTSSVSTSLGPDPEVTIATTSTAVLRDPAPKRKQSPGNQPITKFMKKKSLEEIFAECAAKDRFSVDKIRTSTALKAYVQSQGYVMPRSNTTIWKHICSFEASKVEEQKALIKTKLEQDVRFSITLDEWTDLTKRRYLLINLHDSKQTYNLGLIPIPVGHCGAEVILGLVVAKLEEYGIDPQKHIVASTSDGASVMVSYGTSIDVIVQLCVNHGEHLAVLDTLYEKKTKPKRRNRKLCNFSKPFMRF